MMVKSKFFIVSSLLLLLTGALPSASAADGSEMRPRVELRELAEGVWLHTSFYTYPDGTRFPSNGLIVRQGESLTIIDTAWGEQQTMDLLAEVLAQIKLPISTAIVTHFHGDRVAGVDVLEAHGVKVYAHSMTKRMTIENGLPVPDLAFEGLEEVGDTEALGTLEILYPGPAHSPDNLVVWIPDKRILFGGCTIRATASKSAGSTAHADLTSWLKVLNLLIKKYPSAELVVPGHGEPGGPELIAHTAGVVAAARQPSAKPPAKTPAQ